MSIQNNTPTEYEEQCTFVDWLELQGLKFTAIPNATYTTSYNQKRKNHYSGLRAGLPDMLIITPSGLAFVELKRTKGSKTSEYQSEWIDALNKVPGCEARICKGFEEAKTFITELL